MEALRNGNKQDFGSCSADPKVGNLKGPGGATPLINGALWEFDSVRILLANGADPNIRNEAGATALMWALDDLRRRGCCSRLELM